MWSEYYDLWHHDASHDFYVNDEVPVKKNVNNKQYHTILIYYDLTLYISSTDTLLTDSGVYETQDQTNKYTKVIYIYIYVWIYDSEIKRSCLIHNIAVKTIYLDL